MKSGSYSTNGWYDSDMCYAEVSWAGMGRSEHRKTRTTVSPAKENGDGEDGAECERETKLYKDLSPEE